MNEEKEINDSKEQESSVSALDNMEAQILQLGEEIIQKSLDIIHRNNNRSKGAKKVSASEMQKHEENQRQFKILQTTYMSLRKMGVIKEKRVESSKKRDASVETTDDIVNRVSKNKSTIGAIVRKINDAAG